MGREASISLPLPQEIIQKVSMYRRNTLRITLSYQQKNLGTEHRDWITCWFLLNHWQSGINILLEKLKVAYS